MLCAEMCAYRSNCPGPSPNGWRSAHLMLSDCAPKRLLS